MTPLTIAIVALSCVGALALIALFIYLSNKWLKVTHYGISLPDAPDEGLKIVHLSDLHAARFGKDNWRLLSKIKEQAPDFIAVTGDIIHRYRERDIEVAKRTIAQLSKIASVYFVSGNHEMRSRRWRELCKDLRLSGATVLENESVQTHGVNLCGVNCAHLKNEKLFEVSNGAHGCKILLAHKPEFIARYALAGYDLALCGHAHGGQWRLPFTSIGIYSPGQGLFPKYISGVHTCGKMKEVISRGLGNSECPLRLFNRPEIVVIDINK